MRRRKQQREFGKPMTDEHVESALRAFESNNASSLPLESLTELVLASIKQMTEDEKRVLRETLRWDFYDRKLRPDVVN
jgi:hypothetical protein